MKLSINWLKDYISLKTDTDTLVHRLTMAGLEVEQVEKTNNDTVLDMEVTPNRPDCLNMLGLAREAAAIFNKKVLFPKVRKIKFPSKKCSITIEDRDGCGCYIGTVVEAVRIEPAFKAIQSRLTSIGIRSINNVVDITNFCLIETGQPMHAFDYDKLAGSKVIVRRAKKGEKIVTIDEEERELDPSMLIIADEKKPVAIAGVMGGKETEVTSRTKNILLESAYFDPILIRRTSRKLGLSTDSSYRFERGVDFPMVEQGAARALEMILDHAGGNIVQHNKAIAQAKKSSGKTIGLKHKEVESFLGANVAPAQIKNTLKTLGFKVSEKKKGIYSIVPPSFRGDVAIGADIIEEVARIIGYDNLPLDLPTIQPVNVPANPAIQKRKKVREAMIAQGFKEMVTYAMVSKKDLSRSLQENIAKVDVINPLNQDLSIMRPSLLPSLLSRTGFNINRGQIDLKCFELGKVYLPSGEKEVLSIIWTGRQQNDWRKTTKPSVDFYDIKGAAAQALESLGVYDMELTDAEKPFFDDACSAGLAHKGKEIGCCGKIKKEILLQWDIKRGGDVYFAEIEIESLLKQESLLKKYSKVPEFPLVVRDISIAVDKTVVYEDVVAIVKENGGDILQGVDFIEEYLGEKIEKGQKGLVFSLSYQSKNRTLKEEEVSSVHEAITSAIIEKLQATRR